MKNGGYENENFRHFFGFPILKLVEPQIFRPYGKKRFGKYTYTKSSIFVANSLTHYKNPMVKFLFSFFVALTSLILNQQSKIVYLLKKPRYFNFSDKLSEYQRKF